LNKTFEQGRAEVSALCGYFAKNRGAFCAAGRKEAHVRQDLIDPLFRALGWDVGNAARVAPQYCEVVVEDSLDVEGHQKAPDYTFRVGTLPKFYTEAKKCGVNIFADPAPAYQLRRYGWSAKVAVSILTDFEEMGVYDCTMRPRESDKPSHARILYFRFEEYPDRWRELWDIFSREAVWTGAFDQYAASKRKRGTSEVDSEFLKEIEDWRDALAHNIALRNAKLSDDELNRAVQLTIDRVVFLRMAEDRGLEPYDQLLALCPQGNIYERFMKLCRKADDKYNSGLFHFEKESDVSESPDSLTPRLEIDDKVFKPILQSLYFEHGSPYIFKVLPTEILGTVYERFLGKVIRLTAGHQAKVEEKPEVRKAGGVYYTPKYIVDYIVKQTVERQIEGKSPRQLAGKGRVQPFRILDMACGSGSFLLGAYQCLLDHCLKWYIDNGPEGYPKAVYAIHAGDWRLTISEKKRILTTHIFGVDIDLQAVEVSKLSLLLKVLEGESAESVGDTMRLFHQRALPNLSGNIKCGNSLIGLDYFSGMLIPDVEELTRVNAFDWKREFPAAMSAGGFDCVIGNPPYLNVDDTWGKADIRLAALKTQYPSIYNDKTDILFYFLAKAVQLSRGYVSFIVSRAFLEAYKAYKADKLRKYLLTRTAICEIVDFQNFYVFDGVGITTCIITLQPGAVSNVVQSWKLLPARLPSLDLSKHLPIASVFESVKVKQSSLATSPWAFVSPEISRLNSKIDHTGIPLVDVLTIGQGMQTGANDVFGERSKAEITKWAVPEGAFFKRATNSDIQRFSIRDRGEYVLYVEDVASFSGLPKGVQSHLLKHADSLRSRAAFKRGDCDWWRFTWPLHKEYYNRRRILCPYLANSNRFAIDGANEFLGLTDTTVLFENSQKESLLYLLGLLNSRLLTFRFKSIGKLKSGGIYEYFWNSISKLPIRMVDFADAEDKAAHDRIVKLVDSMLALHKQLMSAKSEAPRVAIKRQVEATDREIDELVFGLYSLTKEEIAIVEGEQGE